MKRSQKSSRQVPDDEAATAAEVQAELDAMSDDQCRRLERYAQSRIRGMGRGSLSSDASALLTEAILATCDGDRRWHKTSVDFFGHLVGVIRSKSSHLYKKTTANKTYLESDVTGEEHAYNPIENSPSRSPNPETSLLADEVVGQIERAISERPIAWLILEALRDGMRRTEIIEEFDISETEYDTNLRWLRRTVLKLREDRS